MQKMGVLHVKQKLTDQRTAINCNIIHFLVFKLDTAGGFSTKNVADLVAINLHKRSMQVARLHRAVLLADD